MGQMGEDRRYILGKTCRDLRAIRNVIEVVTENPEWSNERDAIIVVRRALGPVIDDLNSLLVEEKE